MTRAPATPIPSLLEALNSVPDHRNPSGKRHRLSSILTFVCCGMLCGAKSLLAIFEWGRAHQVWCCQVFGFQRCTPCVNTLHLVFKHLAVTAFEQALHNWLTTQSVNQLQQSLRPLAIDGKTLRGSKTELLAGIHLLSAFAGDSDMVEAQIVVDSKENEITQAPELLASIALEGRVVTGDAIFTQRAICQTIIERGGHYVFEVKNNQPSLREAIARFFFNNLDTLDYVQTQDHGHGRLDNRTLHTYVLQPGELDWVGAQQVCRLIHQTQRQGQWSVQVHYKITSLSRTQSGAAELLALSRGHWGIENRVHYVRDVTLGEDFSRIRQGSAPQAMAAVRNLVLTVMRHTGISNIAAGLRQFGWKVQRAAHVLGLLTPDRVLCH